MPTFDMRRSPLYSRGFSNLTSPFLALETSVGGGYPGASSGCERHHWCARSASETLALLEGLTSWPRLGGGGRRAVSGMEVQS